MTIEFKKLFDQDDGPVHGVVGRQTVVYLDGSVGAFTFEVASTEGQAVLLLEDHAHDWPGEPGRECPDEIMGERLLGECPGVIIATRDPRSLDVIIDALKKLRHDLMVAQGWDMIACTPPRSAVETQAPGVALCKCGKPATCRGCYEGASEPTFACDDCCGHGNEDGWCVPYEAAYSAGTAGSTFACEGEAERQALLGARTLKAPGCDPGVTRADAEVDGPPGREP